MFVYSYTILFTFSLLYESSLFSCHLFTDKSTYFKGEYDIEMDK